jgi:hypothetical protein
MMMCADHAARVSLLCPRHTLSWHVVWVLLMLCLGSPFIAAEVWLCCWLVCFCAGLWHSLAANFQLLLCLWGKRVH